MSPATGRGPRDLLRRLFRTGLVRYGLVGVANASVYYAVYLVTLAAVGYLVAHVIGLGTAMIVSFFLNCRFTFRVRPTWMRLLLYPASQAVNIVATTVGVVLLVHLGVDERIAPLVAAVVAVPASFLVARLVLVRSSPARLATVRPLPAPSGPTPSDPAPSDPAPSDPARPGEARPGEARPGEARPGEARPGEARPGAAPFIDAVTRPLPAFRPPLPGPRTPG